MFFFTGSFREALVLFRIALKLACKKTIEHRANFIWAKSKIVGAVFNAIRFRAHARDFDYIAGLLANPIRVNDFETVVPHNVARR